jgi:RNA polymerase sigma factor (sigma-70 family)
VLVESVCGSSLLPAIDNLLQETERVLAVFDHDVRRGASAKVYRAELPRDHIADLEQDARLALIRAVRRYPVVPERLARRIMKNEFSKRAATERSKCRTLPLPEADAQQDDEQSPDCSPDPWRIDAVRRAMRCLPLAQQRLYEAIYRDGLTQREAAQKFRISQSSVAKAHRLLLIAIRGQIQCAA